MIASSLVSRRWRPGSKESPGCNAGADCAACGVAAEPENGRWRCPRCGAVADGCGDTYGLKSCELLAGHEDTHESRSGTSWPQKPAPVEAPGGQPEVVWREAERGANEGAAERAFEGLLQRLGNDLVDAHGDELPVAVHVVAEEATRVAYTLGAAHARQGTPAEEAERARVLQEARDAGYDAGFASGREQGQRDERDRLRAQMALDLELRIVPPSLEETAWSILSGDDGGGGRARVLRLIDTHLALNAGRKRVRKALRKLRAAIEGKG